MTLVDTRHIVAVGVVVVVDVAIVQVDVAIVQVDVVVVARTIE